MREIKFRAWGIDRGKMHDVYNIAFHESYGYKAITSEQPLNVNTTFINKEEFILMQYTGLKDKNGLDVYEGDIYRNSYGEMLNIYYDVETASFLLDTLDGNHKRKQFVANSSYPDGEVIGNIYENPELLETN